MASLRRTFGKILWSLSVTGPILGKELRVSSRRLRHYLLRSGYVLLMLLVVACVWVEATGWLTHRDAWSVSRMAEAGQMIHVGIVWFQFIAVQLVAIVLLSTAISDEIYNRTLGTLMTTPISSLQIVAGKLFSKIWQLLVLLALSLPLLAIVRVFGGVEWRYVIAGLCVTLTAVVFAGLLSLYFSIHNRRSYITILKTLIVLGILYFGLPFLIGWLCFEVFEVRSEELMTIGLFTPNPVGVLTYETVFMVSAGQILRSGIFIYWQIHCLIMLVASALVGWRCVHVVRRAALAQAVGAPVKQPKRRRRAMVKEATGRIRRVFDPPAIWKELRRVKTNRGTRLVAGLILAALVISYIALAAENDLDDSDVQMALIVILASFASLVTAAVAAGSVTTEKEARTWPALLATALTTRQIISAKLLGVLWRSLPAWGLLAAHTVFFCAIGYIRAVVVIHVAMLATWLALLFAGVGIYFSVRLKRTTSAVVATLGLPLAFWFILPTLLFLGITVSVGESAAEDLLEGLAVAHPTVQAIVIGEPRDYGYMQGRHRYGYSSPLERRSSRFEYRWLHGSEDMSTTTTIMLVSMAAYSAVSFCFLRVAAARARRKIY